MTDNLTVGVTGVHVASAPKTGAVVLKELLSLPSVLPVALVDYPQTCALGWIDRLAAVHLVPQGILGTEVLCQRLSSIASSRGLDVVIPCDDEDALAIASGAHIIKTCGVRTLLPLGDIVRSVKKENLETTLRRLGITVPRQVAISDISNLKMDELDFPVLVKGRLIHAYFARNEKEVRGFATKLSEVWGFPVIVQQFVNGAEFSVCAVADRQSRIAGLCAIRKQGISDQGKTWRAVTIDPDIFEPIVTGFVRGLNWVGPVELEFIMPPSGNQPVVIEVNPRFPAWVPISRRAEADLVKLVVELCQGKRPSKRIVAKAGMCFARTYRTGAFSMAAMARLYAHGSLPAERNGTLA